SRACPAGTGSFTGAGCLGSLLRTPAVVAAPARPLRTAPVAALGRRGTTAACGPPGCIAAPRAGFPLLSAEPACACARAPALGCTRAALAAAFRAIRSVLAEFTAVSGIRPAAACRRALIGRAAARIRPAPLLFVPTRTLTPVAGPFPAEP